MMTRGLALAAAILCLFGLSGCSSTPVEGTITNLRMVEKYKETDTQCNGDPVLLICSDEEVEVGPLYYIEVSWPEGFIRADRKSYRGEHKAERGEPCEFSVSEEIYYAAEKGDPVTLYDSSWSGSCEKALIGGEQV